MRFCDYPANLMREICPECEDVRNRPTDFEQTLAYTLASLPQNMQDVIMLRFYNGETLKTAGDLLGVSKERVRQIEHAALHQLRKPETVRRLRIGMKREMREAMTKSPGKQFQRQKKMSVLDLGLSTRSENALVWAGVETCVDVIKLRRRGIRKIRNLGEKSIQEVISALENAGYDCSILKGKKEEKKA